VKLTCARIVVGLLTARLEATGSEPPGQAEIVITTQDCQALPGVVVAILPSKAGSPICEGVSNTQGRVSFCTLPAGEVVVSARISGFKTVTAGPFRVSAGSSFVLPLILVMKPYVGDDFNIEKEPSKHAYTPTPTPVPRCSCG